MYGGAKKMGILDKIKDAKKKYDAGEPERREKTIDRAKHQVEQSKLRAEKTKYEAQAAKSRQQKQKYSGGGFFGGMAKASGSSRRTPSRAGQPMATLGLGYNKPVPVKKKSKKKKGKGKKTIIIYS